MAKRKRGLIVQISSIGGLQYLFNVAYGVGKTAVRLKRRRKPVPLSD